MTDSTKHIEDYFYKAPCRDLRVDSVHGYGDQGCSISLLMSTNEGEVRLILNGEDAAFICEAFDAIKDTRFLNIC